MLADPDLYTRCSNILNEHYFDKKFVKSVAFIKEYAETYGGLPPVDIIKAETKEDFERLYGEVSESSKSWFMENIEGFCKVKALERAIIKCSDLIENGGAGDIEKIIKEATMISLQQNMGLNYFENPKERLERLKQMNGDISSGWKSFDDVAYQLGRGELIVFTAISGGGKSVALQNLTVNFALRKMNVVYITLELAEELVAKRLDAMITGISNVNIFKQIDTVDVQVKSAKHKSGNIFIKKMPSGSKPNDIKAYLREFQIQNGFTPDAIVVDYMDLIHPNERRIDLSNLFVKDKLVAEALRDIGSPKEFNLICVTASQVNRSGYDSATPGLNNMAGGISKANTADLVVNINNTAQLREQGLIQFQFIKTRNSGGVGKTIDMDYDVETLKISDLPGYTSDSGSHQAPSFKGQTGMTVSAPKPSQGGQSPAVKALLDKVKKIQ